MEHRCIRKVNANNVLKESFGSLKGLKIDSQKMKDEIREEERRDELRLDRLLKRTKLYK